MTKQELAEKIKSDVEWLIKEDCGCSTIKLDDRLAVCVGWSSGYDKNDESVIHSPTEPEFAINAGIKVWTSDDMPTDYDFINYPYNAETGSVWDTSISIAPNDDYVELSQWFLDEYEEMSKWEIEKDGKIIG